MLKRSWQTLCTWKHIQLAKISTPYTKSIPSIEAKVPRGSYAINELRCGDFELHDAELSGPSNRVLIDLEGIKQSKLSSEQVIY
uniref:Uncharacterized protein n=1 Tax=Glossina pallidipes TaxID=7398 RepID=A0A1B0A1B1_GLOPL